MATESPIRMLESDESKKWPSTVDTAMFTSPFSNMAGHEDPNKVLNESSVLREQTSTVPNRSGSAPPTIEGSIASLRTFVDQWNSPLTTSENWFLNFESEEQMRTHPAYIAYYYANVNLNPRLPPPLISQENRNLVRIMRTSGRNKLTSVTEVSLAAHREEPEEDKSLQQTSGDAMKASSGTAIKEDDHGICTASTADQSPKMQESFLSSANVHGDVDPLNSTVTASASSTDFPTTTLYPKIAESLDNMSTRSNVGSDISVLELRMESLNVSGELEAQSSQKTHNNANSHYQYRLPTHPSQNPTSPVPVFHGNVVHEGMHGLHGGMEKLSALYPKPLLVQTFMHTPGNIGPVPPLYMATATYVNSGNLYHPILRPPGLPSPQFMSTTASVFQPPYFGGNLQNEVPVDPYSPAGMFKQPMEGSMVQMNPYANQLLYWSKTYPLHELMMRPSYRDSSQRQYCQQPVHDARMTAIQHDQLSKGQFDVLPLQKNSDIATMMGDKELQHPVANENLGMSAPTNGSHLRFNYYGHPPSLALPHFSTAATMVPGSPMAGSNHPGPSSDVIASQHSPKNTVSSSEWEWQRGSDDSKRHSFLELVKSCNSRKLELSDISGKIIEFSTDQHGSRFIQQKLEHCAIDEKESVFKEVIPHASKLMNDVFGNYVIQKFFEHGNAEQRRKLGEQLVGKILPLSLQMYGCRVIQKALEVLELDQKTELIQELNGHVMRCVHDQNGNHVIQKCIESVPTEKVGFIISSFRGQVAALSSHPYGCRVIQRVLEHCSNEQICRWIVDEILESACDLAQDPYGNYVTQHVLEMSKLRERSQIIRSLTGKFIQMSQHKYASNVVEKCLKYGDASERNLIIEEIVVQPNNDDSLLNMMKDQFGNYVAQKIFDMGNDKQKDILLKCIQIHLSALKKFPYAKQIVARYEQLSEGSAEEQKQ